MVVAQQPAGVPPSGPDTAASASRSASRAKLDEMFRMTQGMRERGELSGMLRHRPGTYHDTWQGWEVED